MWQWYNSRITDIKQQSPTTRQFFLEVETPDNTPFDFKAGQFVTMDLPISEKRLKRWRSYSIANAPTDKSNILEFSISLAAESTGGSKYLFDEAVIGTPIKFKGPDGAFTLKHDVAQNDLIFICTGTGVAPFKSIIDDIILKKMPARHIHLIFGARKEADILYRKEFEALAHNTNWFHYDVALSREADWKGTKGYIHQVYLEKYKTKVLDRQFYLCGWTNMIDEAVANLMITLGYDRSQIHYELYG